LAAFGVVSSLIMKHLSNIAKVFNSAAGMVVVTVVSMVFLGTKVTLPFFLAAATIVASLVSFYGENHGEGGSRGESANRVLGPGSGHVSNGAVSAFTEDEPFVTAGTPGLRSRRAARSRSTRRTRTRRNSYSDAFSVYLSRAKVDH
jgi:hypothetical protein